jgi:hypothetical protein
MIRVAAGALGFFTLIQSGSGPSDIACRAVWRRMLFTLTCLTSLNILREFGAADRTPVSLDPGFGLGGVQDQHWYTL